MKKALCTISYRHHLTSIDEIAVFAQEHDFEAIELWGIHAKHLANKPQYNAGWIRRYGLGISMISDYLPLDAEEAILREKTVELSELAARWGTTRIRTFAGQKGSAETTNEERAFLIRRLQFVCDLLQERGQKLLVETHPGTLADDDHSIAQLIMEVDHPAFRLNFDVLHVWESGADPVSSFKKYEPFIDYLHLKNITSRSQLHVFAPHNVYAAAGSREGMVPLFEGAVCYKTFFSELDDELSSLTGSLEWFGSDPDTVLSTDNRRITAFSTLNV